MHAIELTNVSKVYRRYGGRQFATLKSALLQRSLLRDLRATDTFTALTDVSFSVPKGSTYGVIGRNGSGKSTALKLVAGITKPTTGHVAVNGRISALIELGAGFHPEISGRENVFINGIMLGLSKREIEQRFDEIVEFAELRDFIDAPVKTYSSGMYMRLGFAVAIHVNPDVLLVDEVLAVGDEGFTHKCLDKFAEFKLLGKTILLVTHSLDLVERFCDEALWMDHGFVKAQGDPRRVVAEYRLDVARAENEQLTAQHRTAEQVVASPNPEPAHPAPPNPEPANPAPGTERQAPPPALDMFRATEGRWGSREAEITAVEVVGEAGQSTHLLGSGERVEIRVSVHAATPMTDFVFGIGIFNAEGVCCYGTNTAIDGGTPRSLTGDATVIFAIDALDLVAGTYKLDVAVHRADGTPYDYHRLLYTFRVTSPRTDVGTFRPKHHWQLSGGVHISDLP